jgi:hypothetical protein
MPPTLRRRPRRASPPPKPQTKGSTDVYGARERAANSTKPFRVIKVFPRKFKDGHRGLEYLIGRDEVEYVVPHHLVDEKGYRDVVDKWHKSKPKMTPLQKKCAI